MRGTSIMGRLQLLFLSVILSVYRNFPFGGAFLTKSSQFKKHNMAAVSIFQSNLRHSNKLKTESFGGRSLQLKAAYDSSELADGALQHVVDQPKVVKTLTPCQEAVEKCRSQLEKELEFLESVLLCEENLLKFRIDTLSVSGKSGFVYVQTEVAQFLKKKDAEQKNRVIKNKLEFVQKMLPVVDAFRAAPSVAPPSTEREISIHQNFGSLCQSILFVFEKYGYKEFDSVIGEPVSLDRHEILEYVDGDVEGVIVSQLRPGIVSNEGDIVRRSLVSVTSGTAAVKSNSTGGADVEEENNDKVQEGG